MGNSCQPRYGAAVTNWLIHTQEGNGTAQSLAAYLNNPANGASYHYTIDNSVTVVDVVDTDLASWSVGDANGFTINACFAGSFAGWSRDQWLSNMSNGIDVAAYLAVLDCQKYRFATTVNPPPYKLGRAPGISDHQWVTDVVGWGTHTDCGPGFPWDVFTAAINKYAGNGGDDMPTADDIAKAVWAAQVPKPDGKTEQAGILVGWADKHAGMNLDQLAGPGTKDQTGAGIKPTGWSQLGGMSVVDYLAALGTKLDTITARLTALEAKDKA